MTAASSISQSSSFEYSAALIAAPGPVMVPRRLDEVPGLQALLVRIGRLRHAHFARHGGGVIGVVGAGAEDRRRLERRHELGLGERQPIGAAFGGAGRGLFEGAVGGLPVGEDAGDGRIGRLAGELGSVEHVVADHEARARTFARPICRELVSRSFPPSRLTPSQPPPSHVHCLLWRTKNFQSFLWPIWGPGTTSSSFRGAPKGASPESITISR